MSRQTPCVFLKSPQLCVRSGTVTSPECNVDSADGHTLYLYKFAATHGAFFCVVLVMLAVASVQSSGSKRHVMNAVNAVRDREIFCAKLILAPLMWS